MKYGLCTHFENERSSLFCAVIELRGFAASKYYYFLPKVAFSRQFFVPNLKMVSKITPGYSMMRKNAPTSSFITLKIHTIYFYFSVGYGTQTPQSITGKAIGGFCAIVGVFILTLPVPIVVNSFASYYKNRLWRNEVAHKRSVRAAGIYFCVLSCFYFRFLFWYFFFSSKIQFSYVFPSCQITEQAELVKEIFINNSRRPSLRSQNSGNGDGTYDFLLINFWLILRKMFYFVIETLKVFIKDSKSLKTLVFYQFF